MDGSKSILDEILDEELAEEEDVEMFDVEEGELVEERSGVKLEQNTGADVKMRNEESSRNKKRPRRNRKKNKKKNKGVSVLNITDINRFVLSICKRLKEKKSYLVWAAVGQLGVSALSDLVNEVEAIQKCGGQKTSDGRRFRTGGGILWGVLKERDVSAYKEIMKKGKEFEKQLKQQCLKKVSEQNAEDSSRVDVYPSKDQLVATSTSEESLLVPLLQNQYDHSNTLQEHSSVHDRLRVPVSYDDLLLEGSRDA